METPRRRRRSCTRRSSRPCRNSDRPESSAAPRKAKRQSYLHLLQLSLAIKVQPLRILERDRREAHVVSGLELRDEWQVDGRDLADTRVTAGRLAVGHEDDRCAARRKLDGSERHALGKDFDALAQSKLGALDPIAHAVG